MCGYMYYIHTYIYVVKLSRWNLSVIEGDFYFPFLCFALAFSFSKINMYKFMVANYYSS